MNIYEKKLHSMDIYDKVFDSMDTYERTISLDEHLKETY